LLNPVITGQISKHQHYPLDFTCLSKSKPEGFSWFPFRLLSTCIYVSVSMHAPRPTENLHLDSENLHQGLTISYSPNFRQGITKSLFLLVLNPIDLQATNDPMLGSQPCNIHPAYLSIIPTGTYGCKRPVPSLPRPNVSPSSSALNRRHRARHRGSNAMPAYRLSI
jgi:hypothetical protein